MSSAAAAGHEPARNYLISACTSFDPDSAVAASSGSADALLTGAYGCAAAFATAQAESTDWAASGFKYAQAMTHFDSYDVAASTLRTLAGAQTAAISDRAIRTLADLCDATAGNPADPMVGSAGTEDSHLIAERAIPVCESAAYLWPENPRLHYNLSRAYAADGSEDALSSAEQALAYARQLNYPLASDFNANDYEVPELMAAFYHGDNDTLRQIEQIYRNNFIDQKFIGDQYNYFVYTYVTSFITASPDAEQFQCSGDQKNRIPNAALRALQQKGWQAEWAKQWGFIAFTVETIMNPGALEGMLAAGLTRAQGDGGNAGDAVAGLVALGMPLILDLQRATFDRESAAALGQSDAKRFASYTQCGPDAKRLGENLLAFARGNPMPKRDWFYLSRYEPDNGRKVFYDQCGSSLVSSGLAPEKAAQSCQCVTAGMLSAGAQDDALMSFARQADTRAALLQSAKANPMHQKIVAACGVS